VGFRFGGWYLSDDGQIDRSVSTVVKSSGMLGGLAYNYWFSESLALDISASLMSAKIKTGGGFLRIFSESTTISSVLFGVRYYFPAGPDGGSARAYVKAAIGPFTGDEGERVSIFFGTSESKSETVVGGHLGAGLDLVMSRKILFALNLGYNFMPDFDQSIGARYNYSGLEFSLGLSFVFGRGVE
jgi:hypothetical protein